MRRRTGGYVVAATLLALAVGCTPPSTPPATSPTPVVPSVTPTPTPSENAVEQQMREDQEAAEQAYLLASAEVDRLAMRGGAVRPTKDLLINTTGKYLRGVIGDLSTLAENSWRADRAGKVSVTANRGWSTNELGLTACEDSSEVRLIDSGGQEVAKQRPRLFVQRLIAIRIEGRWKISDAESKVVKSFDGEVGCAP